MRARPPSLPLLTAPLVVVAAAVLAGLGAIDGEQAVALLTLTIGYAFGVATPPARTPQRPTITDRET